MPRCLNINLVSWTNILVQRKKKEKVSNFFGLYFNAVAPTWCRLRSCRHQPGSPETRYKKVLEFYYRNQDFFFPFTSHQTH